MIDLSAVPGEADNPCRKAIPSPFTSKSFYCGMDKGHEGEHGMYLWEDGCPVSHSRQLRALEHGVKFERKVPRL